MEAKDWKTRLLCGAMLKMIFQGILMIKFFIKITFIVNLFGCSSSFSLAKYTFETAFSRNNSPTYESLLYYAESLPYPTLLVKFNHRYSLLVLEEYENDQRIYTSADGVKIKINNFSITATSGFENDLSILAQYLNAEFDEPNEYFITFSSPKFLNAHAKSTYHKDQDKIVELVNIPELHISWKNLYDFSQIYPHSYQWINPSTRLEITYINY